MDGLLEGGERSRKGFLSWKNLSMFLGRGQSAITEEKVERAWEEAMIRGKDCLWIGGRTDEGQGRKACGYKSGCHADREPLKDACGLIFQEAGSAAETVGDREWRVVFKRYWRKQERSYGILTVHHQDKQKDEQATLRPQCSWKTSVSGTLPVLPVQETWSGCRILAGYSVTRNT